MSCNQIDRFIIMIYTYLTQIITLKKFKHYETQVKSVSSDEKHMTLLSMEKKQRNLLQESILRKHKINKLDIQKKGIKNQRLTDIQEEARKRAMHLLERAFNMKLEEEEEIQKCNKYILEAKCRAVRDAQVRLI